MQECERRRGHQVQVLGLGYGYMKDPENPKHWIVDEEAAEVVRRIYDWCMEGYGPTQIARMLKERGVLIPAAHWMKQGRNVAQTVDENRCEWVSDTVAEILRKKEYLGHTVSFKTYRESFRNKKKRENPEEKQLVFENTHEAIVDSDVWERVQKLRENKRRPTKTGKSNMFSGLAVCADCGSKLYYCTTKDFEKRQDHFRCSASQKLVDPCTSHFIRAVVLEEMVLAHIRYVLDYVRQYEDSFRATIGASRAKDIQKELTAKHKRVLQAQKRMEELDSLFRRTYEDNVSGKLTDERFAQLSSGYDAEQRDLREQIALLEKEIAEQETRTTQVEEFIMKCKSYGEIQELTPTILNDLVGKVLVEAPDKSTGKRRQGIHVSYNLVGILPPFERFRPVLAGRSDNIKAEPA